MSGRIQTEGALLAPIEGNVWCEATGTTAIRREIPARWFGSAIAVMAITEAIAILFGDGNVAADITADSGESTETITFSNDEGLYIPAGTRVVLKLPESGFVYSDSAGAELVLSHFSIDAAGTGRVCIWPVSEA